MLILPAAAAIKGRCHGARVEGGCSVILPDFLFSSPHTLRSKRVGGRLANTDARCLRLSWAAPHLSSARRARSQAFTLSLNLLLSCHIAGSLSPLPLPPSPSLSPAPFKIIRVALIPAPHLLSPRPPPSRYQNLYCKGSDGLLPSSRRSFP
ncbi:hypothetical protein B0H63DRAFT_69332 [Podospora didyma]|uniref:Uncharacterized protein n=1 Tax=Podospora didyma TaxID=330526 RepID=A0AAE0K159_9PEZI|nr:hypothetical protein B0H63DRAFT_69332 [Podospora didyma]